MSRYLVPALQPPPCTYSCFLIQLDPQQIWQWHTANGPTRVFIQFKTCDTKVRKAMLLRCWYTLASPALGRWKLMDKRILGKPQLQSSRPAWNKWDPTPAPNKDKWCSTLESSSPFLYPNPMAEGEGGFTSSQSEWRPHLPMYGLYPLSEDYASQRDPIPKHCSKKNKSSQWQ